MNSLGIFFGPRFITIVETKGNKVINDIHIDRTTLFASRLEEKVPEELKLVALFKDEFRKNKIEAGEAALSLSGKDIIIRTFEMQLLPREELKSAINFEAKKHIPFKIEDLISDYQVKLDRKNRRNLVLFAAIKKDTMNKYFSILNQLNIRIHAIEYSAFSILRLVRLAGFVKKGIVGVISVGFTELDEVNFTVLEDGFPLFSRDISLAGFPDESDRQEQPLESGMLMEKLKTELRISLDFYHRKFQNKIIGRIFFVASDEVRGDLELFAKDMGLPAQFMETAKIVRRSSPFSLGFFKAYSSALSKRVKDSISFNLLAPKVSTFMPKEPVLGMNISELFTDIVIDARTLSLGVVICLVSIGFGLYRLIPARNALDAVLAERPQVSTVNAEASYDELRGVNNQYKEKLNTLDTLVKKQLFLTEPLDVIPRVIPEGIWLTSFNFQKGKERTELLLQGVAYQADSGKELELVNTFLYNLKQSSHFTKFFKELNIVSLDQQKYEDINVTGFSLRASNPNER